MVRWSARQLDSWIHQCFCSAIRFSIFETPPTVSCGNSGTGSACAKFVFCLRSVFLDPQTTTHIHFADDMCHVYILRPATNIKKNFKLCYRHICFSWTQCQIYCFPTAECYCWVFAQYRFQCVLGELGRFRAGTGFREPVPGSVSGTGSGSGPVPGSKGCDCEVSKVSVFDGFQDNRLCSRSLDGSGSGNRVPGTRSIKKVPGSGDSIPKGPQVTLYFENILLYYDRTLILLYFESVLLTLKIYWCTLKVYFCTFERIFLYENILLYFESILLYIESILCTLKICFCTLKV